VFHGEYLRLVIDQYSDTIRWCTSCSFLGAIPVVWRSDSFHGVVSGSIYNERRNGIPGLMECLWETGGVSCEVIQGGPIAVGDIVTVLPPEEALVASNGRTPKDGGQPPGFYVRPKTRSAEMVKALLQQKKETKKRLVETDEVGLRRLQRSLESVGLTY
jgi:hypothetical protein